MSTDYISNIHKFGVKEIFLFVSTVIFGTAYTIYSKILIEMPGSSTTNEMLSMAPFLKPFALTFGMFIGMSFSLIVHWFVVLFRIPFPGYYFDGMEARTNQSELLLEESEGNRVAIKKDVTIGMYVYLIIPAFFDLIGIVFCMMGLQYVNASTSQMIRGSVIIFIALIKQYILMQHLHKFHWVGVFWNMISVVIVGSTVLLESSSAADEDDGGTGNNNASTTQTLWGMWLLIAGTFIIAIRCVIEERVMKANIPAPLLLGIKGLWGILLCCFVILLIGESFQAWYSVVNCPSIQKAFIIYCCTAFGYNIFALILMFVLSSVWYAIADNFRTITVWATSLVIFYCVDLSLGEMWTRYSYLQIVGLAILIYGTAIYNAPNNGSIILKGQWWALGIDLSAEYESIRREQKADLDAHLAYENLAEEYDAIIAQEECAEVAKSQVKQ